MRTLWKIFVYIYMKFTWRSGSSARATISTCACQRRNFKTRYRVKFCWYLTTPGGGSFRHQCLILLLLVSYLSVWVAHDEGLLLPCLLFLCFLALDDNLALFVVDIFKASGDVLKLRWWVKHLDLVLQKLTSGPKEGREERSWGRPA